MEEKGVSSIVVIAVVIVIVAVGVGSYFLLKGRGGPGGLSIYAGSQSWDIPSEYRENIPSGVEVAGYSVTGASVKDILNWYKGQMTGWTLENEPVMSMGGVEIGGLIYRKGDDGAGIIAMSGAGLPGTCYILATGPWSAFGGLGTPPSAMLVVTAQGSGSTVTLTISNEGGEELPIADLQVQGSDSTGTMQTAILSPSSGTLSVGETCVATYTYGGAITTRRIITVYIIHKPSQQRIFSSSSVVVEPSAGAPPPSAMLTVTAESIASTDVKITISHEGGDDFLATDLQVQASDSTGVMHFVTMTIPGGTATFTVGGTATGTYDYGADPQGKAITVYVIYKPTGQKIFSSSNVVVQPSTIAPPPSLMLTVSAKANPNNTVTLTISHEGGDDVSLVDLKVIASDSNGVMQTAPLTPSTGTLSVGGTCTATYTYGPNANGAVITVFVIHDPSNQKIFASSSIVVH